MRYFLICVAAFMLLAVPAMAANDYTGDVDVQVTINAIMDFDVTNTSALTLTLSDVWASTDWHDLSGDVTWTMAANQDWDCTVDITDGVDADWPDTWDLYIISTTYTFSEEDVALQFINDSTDTSGSWDVRVKIPWPTEPSSPDCTLNFTASHD